MKLTPQTKYNCMVIASIGFILFLGICIGSWLTMQYYTNKYKEIISTHEKMELK